MTDYFLISLWSSPTYKRLYNKIIQGLKEDPYNSNAEINEKDIATFVKYINAHPKKIPTAGHYLQNQLIRSMNKGLISIMTAHVLILKQLIKICEADGSEFLIQPIVFKTIDLLLRPADPVNVLLGTELLSHYKQVAPDQDFSHFLPTCLKLCQVIPSITLTGRHYYPARHFRCEVTACREVSVQEQGFTIMLHIGQQLVKSPNRLESHLDDIVHAVFHFGLCQSDEHSKGNSVRRLAREVLATISSSASQTTILMMIESFMKNFDETLWAKQEIIFDVFSILMASCPIQCPLIHLLLVHANAVAAHHASPTSMVTRQGHLLRFLHPLPTCQGSELTIVLHRERLATLESLVSVTTRLLEGGTKTTKRIKTTLCDDFVSLLSVLEFCAMNWHDDPIPSPSLLPLLPLPLKGDPHDLGWSKLSAHDGKALLVDKQKDSIPQEHLSGSQMSHAAPEIAGLIRDGIASHSGSPEDGTESNDPKVDPVVSTAIERSLSEITVHLLELTMRCIALLASREAPMGPVLSDIFPAALAYLQEIEHAHPDSGNNEDSEKVSPGVVLLRSFVIHAMNTMLGQQRDRLTGINNYVDVLPLDDYTVAEIVVLLQSSHWPVIRQASYFLCSTLLLRGGMGSIAWQRGLQQRSDSLYLVDSTHGWRRVSATDQQWTPLTILQAELIRDALFNSLCTLQSRVMKTLTCCALWRVHRAMLSAFGAAEVVASIKMILHMEEAWTAFQLRPLVIQQQASVAVSSQEPAASPDQASFTLLSPDGSFEPLPEAGSQVDVLAATSPESDSLPGSSSPKAIDIDSEPDIKEGDIDELPLTATSDEEPNLKESAAVEEPNAAAEMPAEEMMFDTAVNMLACQRIYTLAFFLSVAKSFHAPAVQIQMLALHDAWKQSGSLPLHIELDMDTLEIMPCTEGSSSSSSSSVGFEEGVRSNVQSLDREALLSGLLQAESLRSEEERIKKVRMK